MRLAVLRRFFLCLSVAVAPIIMCKIILLCHIHCLPCNISLVDFEQLLVAVADLVGVPKVPWNVLSTGSHSGSRGGSESSMEPPFKDELVEKIYSIYKLTNHY